jgi:hypothetical protein
MRSTLILLSVFAALPAFTGAAQASTWCSVDTKSGTQICFPSRAQCMADASGKGYCIRK